MVVMKKYCNKFTLVEILAVVALIGILTAIGFGAYTYAMNSAKESSTKALIKRLESGLESCRTKFGYFPACAKSGDDYTFQPIEVTIDSNNEITDIKIGDQPFDPRTKGEYGEMFIKVLEAESLKKYVKDNKLEDAWGGTVYYMYPGVINKTSFDLVSAGADGFFGDPADKAKTPPTVRTKYDTQNSDGTYTRICDDITNF